MSIYSDNEKSFGFDNDSIGGLLKSILEEVTRLSSEQKGKYYTPRPVIDAPNGTYDQFDDISTSSESLLKSVSCLPDTVSSPNPLSLKPI